MWVGGLRAQQRQRAQQQQQHLQASERVHMGVQRRTLGRSVGHVQPLRAHAAAGVVLGDVVGLAGAGEKGAGYGRVGRRRYTRG